MSEPDEFELTDSEGRPGVASLPLWSEDFVRQETARLYRLVAAPWLGQDQVEDIVQEVWLRLLQHRSRFPDRAAVEHLRRWMAQVAWNQRADQLRRLRRHPLQSLDDLLVEPVAADEAGPADREEEERQRELLRRWLAELHAKDPLNHRLVYGRYLEGQAVEALAAEAGLTVPAVYFRLHRQIKKFAARASRHLNEGMASA